MKSTVQISPVAKFRSMEPGQKPFPLGSIGNLATTPPAVRYATNPWEPGASAQVENQIVPSGARRNAPTFWVAVSMWGIGMTVRHGLLPSGRSAKHVGDP